MIVHIALALVAAFCAGFAIPALSPQSPRSVENKNQAGSISIVMTCVFILVLAAERGWYS